MSAEGAVSSRRGEEKTAGQGGVRCAFQVNHHYDRPVGKEGNDDIMSAKSLMAKRKAGSMVYVYWLNSGAAPRQLADLRWNGAGFDHWNGADGDYQAIWRSCRPERIEPGTVGEIALCLRHTVEQPTAFELLFDDGSRETVVVQPQDAPAHFATIAFTSDLRTARCFIEEAATATVSQVVVDGKSADIAWWNGAAFHGLRVAELTFKEPLTSGERLTFLALDQNGKALTGASLRTFGNLSTFGTYGYGELRRYAENGLDSFNSFGVEGKKAMDKAAELRLRIVTATSTPNPITADHPALYAYMICDEPDCHDFGKWEERPMDRRIGGCAMEMLQRYGTVAAGAPLKPALLTLDLTFTPYNYFIYGPLADISNPDIYTNTCGWNVKYIDHHLNMVKRATAPRPFAYTYQSCWEEWSRHMDHWIGRNEVLEKGFDFYRDKERKTRGFGFNTNPDEIAIAMHYALQNGATALFAFTDATECSGLLFHGSDVLPENWAAVGRNSRKFGRIGSLLCPAHPMTLATATGLVQVSTLLADRDHLLVVAVNEAYTCDAEGFSLKESDTVITLPLPPWLAGHVVHRVDDKGFETVAARTGDGALQWNARVRNGEIYLVSRSEVAARQVMEAAETRERLAAEALKEEEAARNAWQLKLRQLREKGDAIDGFPLAGYLIRTEELPIRTDGDYNALESWEANGTQLMGAQWVIPVAANQTGQKHELLWAGRIFGAKAQVTLTAPDGSVVFDFQDDLSSSDSRVWSFTPKTAGDYTLRSVGAPTEPAEHGSRIARWLYRSF